MTCLVIVRSRLKSDTEPAIVAFRNRVAEICKAEVTTEDAVKGDKESNGFIENAVMPESAPAAPAAQDLREKFRFNLTPESQGKIAQEVSVVASGSGQQRTKRPTTHTESGMQNWTPMGNGHW